MKSSAPGRSGSWSTLGPTTLAIGIAIGLSAVFADKWRARALLNDPAPSPKGRLEPARSPTEISGAGWRQVLVRTWREFGEDRVPAVAAGATFYSLLALFPAIGAFVSLYGLFADVEDARRQLTGLGGVLPEGAVTVLGDQLTMLAAAPQTSLGLTFLFSLALSLWSANAGVKGVIAGLNISYEEKEKRNFFRLNLVSLAFTAGAVVFALTAVASMAMVPGLLSGIGVSSLHSFSWMRWPLLLAVVVSMLSLLYRFGPSRVHSRWRWITPGGVLAAVGWLVMSLAYSVYVANFGSFNKTYGSLGAVVGFMIWIWLSLIVVLLGAELNSELEQQTSVDTTTGPPRPPGLRGAAVADGKRRVPRSHGAGTPAPG